MLTSNPNKVRIHSQKIVPGLGAHKRSHPDLKHLTKLEMSSPDLSEVRVRPHKRSDANSMRLTLAASVSANPNQVRVQRRASVQCVSANPNEVRVRPHKESGANSKRLTSVASVSANPNEVRVRPHKESGANSKRLTSVASVSANPNEVRVRGKVPRAFQLLLVHT